MHARAYRPLERLVEAARSAVRCASGMPSRSLASLLQACRDAAAGGRCGAVDGSQADGTSARPLGDGMVTGSTGAVWPQHDEPVPDLALDAL